MLGKLDIGPFPRYSFVCFEGGCQTFRGLLGVSGTSGEHHTSRNVEPPEEVGDW